MTKRSLATLLAFGIVVAVYIACAPRPQGQAQVPEDWRFVLIFGADGTLERVDNSAGEPIRPQPNPPVGETFVRVEPVVYLVSETPAGDPCYIVHAANYYPVPCR